MPGVSTFDLLGDMPSPQRTLVRLFLRHIKMSLTDLESKVGELPDDKRLTKEQIQDALQALTALGWIKRMDGSGEVYSLQQIPSSR